jgi:hypothetical protein
MTRARPALAALLGIGLLACASGPTLPDAVGVSSKPVGPGRGRRARTPLPEAYESCAGKRPGEACLVEHEDEEFKGTCIAPPEDATDPRLVCTEPVPDRDVRAPR